MIDDGEAGWEGEMDVAMSGCLIYGLPFHVCNINWLKVAYTFFFSIVVFLFVLEYC